MQFSVIFMAKSQQKITLIQGQLLQKVNHMVYPFPLQSNIKETQVFIWFVLNTINQELPARKDPCQLKEFEHLKGLCETYFMPVVQFSKN